MKGNAELRFEDAVIRTSLIAAPLLMLLSGLVLPQLRGPDGTELSVSASYPGRYYAYVLLGLAGSAVLVPAVYGIVRRTRLRRARLGAIGGGLALIGAALSLADWGGELVKVEMGALSTTYHDAMVALLDRFDSSARIAAPLQISGIAFLLGMILLAIGLFRGRTAPGWVCARPGRGDTWQRRRVRDRIAHRAQPRKRRASPLHGISRCPASDARRRAHGPARRQHPQQYSPSRHERRDHPRFVSAPHSHAGAPPASYRSRVPPR